MRNEKDNFLKKIQMFTPLQNSLICNPSPDDKIFALTTLEAFADDESNVTQNMKLVFHWTENIVRKGENAGFWHFLLFTHCFQTCFSSGVSKVVIVWQRVKKKRQKGEN